MSRRPRESRRFERAVLLLGLAFLSVRASFAVEVAASDPFEICREGLAAGASTYKPFICFYDVGREQSQMELARERLKALGYVN